MSQNVLDVAGVTDEATDALAAGVEPGAAPMVMVGLEEGLLVRSASLFPVVAETDATPLTTPFLFDQKIEVPVVAEVVPSPWFGELSDRLALPAMALTTGQVDVGLLEGMPPLALLEQLLLVHASGHETSVGEVDS